MISNKKMIAAVLATFCLTSVLFSVIPIRSPTTDGEYDPWIDTNDDGIINYQDLGNLAIRFGSLGTPINKTEMLLELHTARAHNETYSESLETISGYSAMFYWQDIPSMTVEITLETDATLLITFSAQAVTTQTWLEMHVRAMIDSTQANPPNGVVLTKSNEWASYSYTFYGPNISTGTYTIKIQWKLSDEVGSGQVRGRTLTVIALPA